MTPDNEVNPLLGIVADALIAQKYDFIVQSSVRYDLAEELARTVLIALSDASQVVAERFHEHYEVLAPTFSYATRVESAVPWRDVPENNRQLMTMTCATVFNV